MKSEDMIPRPSDPCIEFEGGYRVPLTRFLKREVITGLETWLSHIYDYDVPDPASDNPDERVGCSPEQLEGTVLGNSGGLDALERLSRAGLVRYLAVYELMLDLETR